MELPWWSSGLHATLPMQGAQERDPIVQFSSVAQSCPTLCDPMDCSMPGFPVYHQLPELAQTHVHRVSDAIQPSDPLSSPSPPAFDLPNIMVFFSEIPHAVPKTWHSQKKPKENIMRR